MTMGWFRFILLALWIGTGTSMARGAGGEVGGEVVEDPESGARSVAQDATEGDKRDSGADDPQEKVVVTHHEIEIDGETLSYTATAGTMILRDGQEKPLAEFFYVAYTLDGVQDRRRRPISFTFNGGPGSSSVWLHMGTIGPKRVVLEEDGSPPPPPYGLADNEETLLDVSDLVFIDPVTTGYSRAVPRKKDAAFHGVEGDLESVGNFIRLYTTRHERWLSPKYLIGESYGSTRAAALSNHLARRHGMFVNGVALISVALNFQTFKHHPGNELPHVLFLPSFTATAWYHGKLSRDLQVMGLKGVLERSETFAEETYAPALHKGDRLGPRARDRVIREYAQITGLSPEFVDRCNLRVTPARFFKELLREEGRTVGRMDSRLTGHDRDRAGEQPEFDPSLWPFMGPYTAGLYHHVRANLKFESDLDYEILTSNVWPWNFKGWSNRYLDVSDGLRAAMAVNPHLRVFVASGYYDLATPYHATDHTLDHLGIPTSQRSNITMAYYEAGHMMYNHEASRLKLKQDLKSFFQD